MNNNKDIRNSKKNLVILSLVTLLVAGLLDLKYKGLFYQFLPQKIQSFFDNFLEFNK